MDWLICAATEEELRAHGGGARAGARLLVTGVGIPCALATVLQAAARERPARILNIGIAGAYPGSALSIGGIVTADSEVYGDLGFELPEPPGFRPLQESPFGAFYQKPFSLLPLPNAAIGRGCTVNACTGTDATGRLREMTFGAKFETMEGAAVAHAGSLLGIPVSEVRAISNVAGHRDMQPDNIRLALDSLARFVKDNPLA